jgi:hypothetical protein
MYDRLPEQPATAPGAALSVRRLPTARGRPHQATVG